MAFSALRVQTCIGCIPLQRGSVIIGFLALFGSLLEMFKCILLLVDFELSLKQCQNAENELLLKPTRDDDLLDSSAEDKEDDDDRYHDKCPSGTVTYILRINMVLRAFTFFIYFILTALMIHGAKTGRYKLMTPWLWWQMVQIVFTILALCSLWGNVNDIVSSIFIVIVVIYFSLVVNSYYLQLRESAARPADVTVVAVAHPTAGMTVMIPSPRKDDPPPPYPGLAPGYNPVYNPVNTIGYPPAPPYTPSQNCNPVSPPPYEINIPNSSVQASQPAPQSQNLHANVATSQDPAASEAGEEAAPLVDKRPLPQN
ncbi:hypothetical protein OTU49_011387 [Cherax quadricarinatus]|uniref:Uncharacterized protein n=2 Tax=Cherax quadricarinatus TaxID=27406 RepID=A0AAW0W5U7_CHEQU|nr:uncharacterized protein LOC128703767 isoform X1 [Cherax quadricarinatus]XP_053654538.1 uncharacterized protein LOC128703767 isoform X1 [Cherax quadricarinatus]XP_053654539.1 uncharacterized protein LOC128703767 isoform X1 [Cherax quadricarinatus]XP_053654540.1 uncharacterized protein LOC128703767 isoform X1 [Cherax quadricarinatus]